MKSLCCVFVFLFVVEKVASDCFEDCERTTGYKWICGKSFGCEDCPFEDTCEKLCTRCEDRDNNAYGGLDCDCTDPAPTIAPPPDCFNDCDADSGKGWLCSFDFGCTECTTPKVELCEKLCSRCEGRENNGYAGLGCTCSGDDSGIPVVTSEPADDPTAQPTTGPTANPTAGPTTGPTAGPTANPTANPTAGPTAAPTDNPTLEPTSEPTANPTADPTAGPTAGPTDNPTSEPTAEPTANPTADPTARPTAAPTDSPTSEPTSEPTANPTADPTVGPTAGPTDNPTSEPTAGPTVNPTAVPTSGPTTEPTHNPTSEPTDDPTAMPADPTAGPTAGPTAEPTAVPTAEPTAEPTGEPTGAPTVEATTAAPNVAPTAQPTTDPTAAPNLAPTVDPAETDAPVIPSGPCWSTCGSNETSPWICSNTKGCEGCPKTNTCEKLCGRCTGESESTYGGLDCDCSEFPTAAPVSPICWPACEFDSGGKWVCDKEGFGCLGCADTDDVCTKLCNRCEFEAGENAVAGLTCSCL